MIQIIDDFLPPSYHQGLCQLMNSDQFPWYYANGVTSYGDGDFFFTHNVFRKSEGGVNSDFWNEFKPMIFLIEDKLKFHMTDLLRIKCNCYTNQNKKIDHKLHIDFPEVPHYTALYYTNTSNGPTVFKTDNGIETVDAVENRLIFFSGNIPHHSTLQTDSNVRINVNINLQGVLRE